MCSASPGVGRQASPARVFGRDLLLGDDLIIQFAAREVCTEARLREAAQYLKGVFEIPIFLLSSGKMLDTGVDVSGPQQGFLAGE